MCSAAGRVIEHAPIAHVLGDRPEPVHDGFPVTAVAQSLGSKVAVEPGRDPHVIQHGPIDGCNAPVTTHPWQDPGQESDHGHSQEHRDGGGQSGHVARTLQDLRHQVGDSPAQ